MRHEIANARRAKPLIANPKGIEREAGRLDRSIRKNHCAIRPDEEGLPLTIGYQIEADHRVAGAVELQHLGSRQQEKASADIATATIDGTVVPKSIDEKRTGAEFVEREYAWRRRTALNRQWRFLHTRKSRQPGKRSLERAIQGCKERRLDDVISARVHTDFALGEFVCAVIPGCAVQIRYDLARPLAEIVVGQARRPATPEHRASADAVCKAAEGLIADPRHAPNDVLSARVSRPCIVRTSDLPTQTLR
jgi:hypothetical protein